MAARTEHEEWCMSVMGDCERERYKCRVCFTAWEAAPDIMEKKFTSTNKASDAITANTKEVIW